MKIDINIPDGKSGNWAVETFTVSEDEARLENLRAAFSYSSRGISPGTYKRLMRGGTVVMSNTPAEISDHLCFIYRSKRVGGDILINGLGLGVALSEILKSDLVRSVTVIEKSNDVINLVAGHFANDHRVSIINQDAFEFNPPKGKRYSTVWHDIWDYICSDNLPEMTRLHRKYGRRCDWQDSWCKKLCKRQRNRW